MKPVKNNFSSWQPDLDELNRAIGVFKGIYTEKRTNPKTGKKIEVESAYFAVLGGDGEEKNIPVELPEKYHKDNTLGKFGEALGFRYKPKYRKNENGFQVLDGDNLDELDEVIVSCENKTFTFKIQQNINGSWDIQLTTLKSYDKKPPIYSKDSTDKFIEWNGHYLRSEPELQIAKALDRRGIVFWINAGSRITTKEGRKSREQDFLVSIGSGKIAILEIDGREYHQSAADDHKRDLAYKKQGFETLRFTASECMRDPDSVVSDFIEALKLD